MRDMAKYAPPEGYTLDESSGMYFSSALGTDPKTGVPVQWVTWFDANTCKYLQHTYLAEQQTVATQPAKKSGKVAAIIAAVIILLFGGAVGGHFAGLYTLPFLPAGDDYADGVYAYYPEEVEPEPEYEYEEPEPDEVPLGTMLGIYPLFMTPEIADYYGLVVGYWVSYVIPGIAADRAGIIAGDIITSISEVKVDNPYVIVEILNSYRADDVTTVTVHRDGTEHTLFVILDGLPPEGLPTAQDRDFLMPPSPDPAAALVGEWSGTGIDPYQTYNVYIAFHADGRFEAVRYIPYTGFGVLEEGTFTVIGNTVNFAGRAWTYEPGEVLERVYFPDVNNISTFSISGNTLTLQSDEHRSTETLTRQP